MWYNEKNGTVSMVHVLDKDTGFVLIKIDVGRLAERYKNILA